MQATGSVESVERALNNDAVLNLIQKKFISLDDNEVKRNNEYVQGVLPMLIEMMKSKDLLFSRAYKETLFFGSFYKKTRVGKPTEFDLNIVLDLPIDYGCLSFHSSEFPSFIDIKVHDLHNSRRFKNLTDREKRILERIITNGSLNPNKFRSWFEGVIDKVRNDFSRNGNAYNLPLFGATIKIIKSGPAFTLKLNFEDVGEIDVDLVPALTFKIDVLSQCITKFYELQRCKHKVWFAIPVSRSSNTDAVWRIAFSHQEKEILEQYGRIKPVIRQLKKLRETQNCGKIASYFIETVCLNNIQEFENDLNVISFTLLFYKMLQKLQIACERHEIQWFWDDRYNLVRHKISEKSMMNISARLKKIIKDIEKKITTQSFILAKYILTTSDLVCLSRNALLYPFDYNEVNPDHLFLITKDKIEDKDPGINENEDNQDNQDNQDQSWRCIIL